MNPAIPRRVGVVVNPASGARRGPGWADRLPELGPGVRWTFRTPEPEWSLDWLGSFVEELDLLVIVGGDGTVGKVASSLKAAAADPPPLSIVPAGRGNSAYRHYYGDRDWRDLIRGLLGGMRTGPLDLGEVRSDAEPPARSFVLGASVGLFPRSLRAARRLSWLPGLPAYLLGSAWAGLVGPPVRVAAGTAGGEDFEGEVLLAAVGGGRFRARRYELFPGARPGREHLDLLLIEPCSLREYVGLFADLRRGEHVGRRGVHRLCSPRVTIRAPGPIAVEMDGTLFAAPARELTLTARPGALRMAHPGSRGEGRRPGPRSGSAP